MADLDLTIYTKRGTLRKNKSGNLNKPTTHGKQVCFRLSLDVQDFALAQEGTISDYLNELIRKDMERKKTIL